MHTELARVNIVCFLLRSMRGSGLTSKVNVSSLSIAEFIDSCDNFLTTAITRTTKEIEPETKEK